MVVLEKSVFGQAILMNWSMSLSASAGMAPSMVHNTPTIKIAALMGSRSLKADHYANQFCVSVSIVFLMRAAVPDVIVRFSRSETSAHITSDTSVAATGSPDSQCARKADTT